MVSTVQPVERSKDCQLWINYTIDAIEKEKFTNREGDLGSKTKFGITERFLHAWEDENGFMRTKIQHIDRKYAESIYELAFWLRYQAESFHPVIAWCYLDGCVNHGESTGVKFVQIAVDNKKVKPDGIMGPITIKALKEENDLYDFWTRYRVRRVQSYSKIVRAKPEQAVNIGGWINRMFLVAEGILIHYFNVKEK